MHACKAFLVYWKEEDSVNLACIVEQSSEPKVGDMVKVKFQLIICQGQVAAVGSTDVIQQKVEDFLDGIYTPFSRKRAGSPLPEAAAKRVPIDKENMSTHQPRRETGRG